MKRSLLFLFVGLLASQQMLGATWLRTIGAAQAEAKKKNKLIFVDLFAEWCGWCHRMEREVFPSEKFQQATSDMVLLRLDTEDRGEGSKFARDFQVRSLPTFLILTPDLAVAGVLAGYSPSSEFAQRVGDARKEYAALMQRLEDEPKYAKDYQQRLDMAKQLISRRAYAAGESRLTKLTEGKGVPQSVRDTASYTLALSYAGQKKYAASLAILNKLLARTTKGEPAEMGRILLGQIYYEQGNYAASLRELKKFQTSFPGSAMMATVNAILPEVERAAGRQQ